MDTTKRTAILIEDFNAVKTNSKYEFWKHKKLDVLAIFPKKESLINEIIFLRCKINEVERALEYGVKFRYNTEEELMTFIVGISENQ